MIVVEFPGCKSAVARNATLYLDNASRAEIRPGELPLASPRHLYRTTGRTCQACGFERRITGVLAAIRRTCVRDDDAHDALRNMERVRKLAAHAKWSLRAGPYRQLAVLPLSDG